MRFVEEIDRSEWTKVCASSNTRYRDMSEYHEKINKFMIKM